MKDASKIVPNKGKGPVTVTGRISLGIDLAAIAKAVNAAKTPHRKQSPPGATLVLFAKLDAKSAAAITKALAAVKGIDAKGSKADIKKGEISVKITGTGKNKVTVSGILTAMKDAGVEASLTKS